MSTIPPILVKLQADVSGLKSGLAQAEQGIKSIDGNVKTASAGMGKFTSTLKSVGAAMGIAFAGQQVANFAKQSVLAASNMNESVSKVGVVFEDTAGQVLEWGKTAATTMGISNQKAIESAGTYGNLFQALGITKDKSQEMSTSMVQLAADLGSFNNMSVDDSLNALRSGLSGETEPLKRFGISLNEVTLKNKAMAMGFGEIKGVMDPAIKAQVTYALVMEQTKKAQGDYARTSSGTANTMKTLSAQFEDAKVAVGDLLLPAFNALLKITGPIIAGLKSMAIFMKENKNAVATFTVILLAGVTAWGIYTAVTKAAIIQQKIFNLVSKLNPIGLIITAVALLAAGMVVLWNKSETFRKIIIGIGKAGITAFSFIIGVVGDLVTGMMKLVSGPLRLLLKGLSLLGVKEAGSALKTIDNAIETTGKFFDDAAKKVASYGSALDKLATKKGPAYDPLGGNTPSGGGSPTTTPTTKGKGKTIDPKKLKSYLKEVSNIYDDMNKAINDSNEKVAEATLNRDEDIAKAQKKFAESTANARKDNAKRLIAIEKDYAKQTATIEENLQKKIKDLRQAAADKSADLIKSATERQASIIQQGVDRLRSAFASGTGWNIADAFKESGSTEGLLADLKKKLQAAKDLQANAAALAGLGYSQVFIEEVVKNGPEAGNAIAKALQEASPDATKELQQLYYGLEDVSAHGLDALAKTMSTSTSFATEELLNAYNQVGIDLTQTLAEVNTELNKNLAEAQAEYTKAMAEAKIARDENMAEAAIALQEALDEASKDLANSLIEIQKTFQKAIDDINKATMEKMAELQKKLKETADLIAALGAAQAAAAALANAPKYIAPILPNTNITPKYDPLTGKITNINTTVNATTNASAASIANTVTQEIKFGTAVVTLPKGGGW